MEQINYAVKPIGKRYQVIDETTGKPIAVFESQSDATDYRYFRSMSNEDKLNAALNTVRSDYWQDVRDTAESIQDELNNRLKDRESGESLREWLIEYIDETIDGCGRVIYTAQAMLGLYATDNDGAYAEEFGPEGMVEDGCINWSRLMYSAMRQDVLEQLESNGVDVNKPVPECASEYSGAVWCDEDGDNERYEVAGNWVCEGCKHVLDALELVPKLSRAETITLLESASVECRDDEDGDTLTEALRVNVSDGTIDASDVLAVREVA